MRIATLFVLVGCAADVRPSDIDTTDFVPLIEASWSLDEGTESYLCVRKTITEPMWIKSVRPVAPAGTHHTVLMVGPADAADGVTECNSTLAKPAIYASGVGTQTLDLPEGVALHLEPGDQLLLNLHLFNSGSEALTGLAGIEVLPTTEVDEDHIAGVVLTGKGAGLVVPPGASTQTGECTTPAGLTVFAVAPHMHTRGTHMKVSYMSRVLFDDDYSFDDQRFHVLEPSMSSVNGQKMQIECSYFNETAANIPFGESTSEEMCYALTFVYPRPSVDSCTR